MSQRDMKLSISEKTSRRGFLKGAAALGAVAPLLGQAQQSKPGLGRHRIFAYVGSYSRPQGPDNSIGRGQGIYIFEMNPADGALVQREIIRRDTNPSFTALDASRKHLYSVDWIPDYQGTHSGSVSVYSVDRGSGHLTLLNTVSSEGANPTHLSIHLPASSCWWPATLEERWPCCPFTRTASWARPPTSFTIKARLARNAPPALLREALPSAGTIILTPTWSCPMWQAASFLRLIWPWTAFSFGSSTPRTGSSSPTIHPPWHCPRATGRDTSRSIPAAGGSIRCRKKGARWSLSITIRFTAG